MERTSAERRSKPEFFKWNLTTPQAGLRLFQGIGALTSLIFIGSVGSQFSPTYASLMVCTIVSIVSPMLVIAFAFNLHNSTKQIDWMLWEILYAGSGAFLFFINSITMSYSSIRWGYVAWYLGAVFCILVCAAFIMDTILSVRVLRANPNAKHSQSKNENNS